MNLVSRGRVKLLLSIYSPPRDDVRGNVERAKFRLFFSRYWVGLGGEPDALPALFPRKEPQVTWQ